MNSRITDEASILGSYNLVSARKESVMKNTPKTTAKKIPLRGTVVRVMTPEERVADMQAFGRKIRRSKASAVAFLQRAGFIDETGQLTEPYRS